jgi:hypothetical protein
MILRLLTTKAPGICKFASFNSWIVGHPEPTLDLVELTAAKCHKRAHLGRRSRRASLSILGSVGAFEDGPKGQVSRCVVATQIVGGRPPSWMIWEVLPV